MGVYVWCDRDVFFVFFFFLMRRRPPRSTQSRSSAASDVYKRQIWYYGAGVIDSRIAQLVHDNLMRMFPDSMIQVSSCLLYTSPSPRDRTRSRMPSSA